MDYYSSYYFYFGIIKHRCPLDAVSIISVSAAAVRVYQRANELN